MTRNFKFLQFLALVLFLSANIGVQEGRLFSADNPRSPGISRDPGMPRTHDGHVQMQPQPIGFRRIRIHRFRPGQSTTLSPPPMSGVETEGDNSEDIDDWGVEAITNDPYTFFRKNIRPIVEDEQPGGGAELDESERERHEQLKKMRLLQLQRELRLQRPELAASEDDNLNSNSERETSENSNSTLKADEDRSTGSFNMNRKRNCSVQNTTSGREEVRCEEVNNNRGTTENSEAYWPQNRNEWIVRERTKQARLFMIQTSILQKLGIQRQPSLPKLSWSDSQKSKLMQALMNYGTGLAGPVEDTRRYTRSFSLLTPSCDLPCNSHRDWSDGSRFRLYFNVLPPVWKMTKISTASLRLYKRPISDCDCHVLSQETIRERGNRRRHRRLLLTGRPRRIEEELVTVETPKEGEGEDTQTERSVRVSVFAYKKPVKARRKERVQFIDSLLVTRAFEGWLKLDIRKAVTQWFQNPVKNYGLMVQIEDDQRRELDPFSVITPTNCSIQNNFSLPYPLAVTDEVINELDSAGNQTTPYLDLVTLGIPQSHSLIRRDTSQQSRTACRRRHSARRERARERRFRELEGHQGD